MARKTKADALKTRQLLIDAAIEQFAKHGVTNTTLSDIADAAGVTRGAVYWHFSSKTELFNEMWEQQVPLNHIIKYIRTENENPLIDLQEKFIAALQYIAETPKQRALMQILYHKCEFTTGMMTESEIRNKMCVNRNELREALLKCIHYGILPVDTNVDVMVIMLRGFFSGIIKNWLMEPGQFNLYQQAPVLADNIMSTLTRASCTPPTSADSPNPCCGILQTQG
ncbi:acrEF/envCD operon transcriptional regulator [Trabulsiella odontotermitis]|uniref:acrEF/envCD operon transcriptional regulator n=1 Tax=Trabulsiella odontotermitis TaxID=379893 RepID=UPI0024B7C904|nr:acrEF/envCD operon transcriptional regulator [Trabulsiella odontotermitis]WHP31727.1 acrEF/envCD operon transcriptional regulator [Trabulsiella odontotermitis]